LSLMLPRRSLRPSRTSCSRMPLTPTSLKPENCWALGPFLFRC
jgi:hypothetical protein